MRVRPKVALLIETSNGYARGLLQGIRAYVREHDPWSIYLSEHGRGEGCPRWFRRWKGDGILARVESEPMAQTIQATRLPAVDLSFALEHSPFPRVVTDSRAVTRLAAEHLLERGFKHFGFCGEDRYHWSKLRAAFFAAEIASAGYLCRIYPEASCGGAPDSWEGEIDAIVEWLRTLERPAGVMACYDIRGQQVIEACRRMGVGVPDEVAVVGVHNDELLCDLCDPPLTSVIPNARRAGYEAAAMLDRLLRGEPVAVESRYIEPIGIATRQSTDVVAVDDPKVSAAVRFMRENACVGITVSDVLRAVPMSRSMLERRFKQLLGCTPHEQILRIRIQRVKTMLSTTSLPLAVIAERAGFEHTEYLSVVFKRVTGYSPHAYRTQSRAGIRADIAGAG